MKYNGKLGFEVTEEEPIGSGVWIEHIVEKPYYGDVLSNRYKKGPSDKVNSNMTINNRISIVADLYAYRNFQSIAYAEFMGIRWIVDEVEVDYPRLQLTLGGEYHGKKQA